MQVRTTHLHQAQRAVVKSLLPTSARDTTFQLQSGQIVSVEQHYQQVHNV